MTSATRSRLGFIAVAVALAGAGCVHNHPIHYYSIAAPPATASEPKPAGPTVLVGLIQTPESLQDARISYQAANHEVGFYEFHRWAERPGSIVRDALVYALRASGQYRRVLEASSAAQGDYLVRGRLHAFGEVDNPAIVTRIAVHLEIVDQKTGRDVWDRHYIREEPSTGKSINDVVGAMDRNLQQVANEAAKDIGAFVQSNPG